MMLQREAAGILQPMGVVEFESGVIVRQGSSSTTAVEMEPSDVNEGRRSAGLTLRMRSAASGDTESGMRRSTLHILRYVATIDVRQGRG